MIYSHELISVARIPQTYFVAYPSVAFKAILVQIIPRFEPKILFT